MKYILLINIFFVFWAKFNRIAEMNELKEQAFLEFQKGEFIKCISLYQELLNHYNETDETIKLNLANCYFQLKEYNSAIDTYKLLINSKEPLLKSTAYLQLGVIYSSNNKKELGLSYFKEALKSMPENEEARYNFELLRKDQDSQHKDTSPERKKENEDGKNKTTYSNSEESKKSESGKDIKNSSNGQNAEENSDEETDENLEGGEDEELQYSNDGKKETDALTSLRLEEVNITERQAKMILKTMKNNEVQYIQQRRKIISTKQSQIMQDW